MQFGLGFRDSKALLSAVQMGLFTNWPKILWTSGHWRNVSSCTRVARKSSTLFMDDRRKNAFGLLMSLNMLIETPGGFDSTGAECSSWMREAGFRDTYLEHLTGPDWMVVGVK